MSSVGPVAVFGLPAYDDSHLAEALESILGQARGDLAIVVADDSPSGAPERVVARYADLDDRLVYERNERRLGLVGNWRRVFDLARARFPSASYFAWASDHDVWHPRWLELLTAELDAHPEAVLAYPYTVRIDEAGAEFPTRERRFDTAGVGDAVTRVRRCARDLSGAGELVYGLFRRDALERCGPFPLVALPDRLLLVRLAYEGEFHQVSRRLWYRRSRSGVAPTKRRQRRNFYPDGVPLRAYAPWWLAHAVLLRRSLPGEGGALGDLAAAAYAAGRARRARARRWRRREWRKRLPRQAPRGEASRTMTLSGAEAALRGLERADVLDDVSRVLELGEPGGIDAPLDFVVAREPAQAQEAELAMSIGYFGRIAQDELERWVERLDDVGVPLLYSFDSESDVLRSTLATRYWLREPWVEETWPLARKPDPNDGPVPRTPGLPRHVVGRRRLLAESEIDEATMLE